MSDSLRPHQSQHARPPCPSPTRGVYSNSCPSSRWCHPTISSSVVPFSSCPQSLPASGSFPMSQLFAWGGQSIGVSASASVLPVNTQDWSPSGWTGWISLQSKGLSRVFSNTTVQTSYSLVKWEWHQLPYKVVRIHDYTDINQEHKVLWVCCTMNRLSLLPLFSQVGRLSLVEYYSLVWKEWPYWTSCHFSFCFSPHCLKQKQISKNKNWPEISVFLCFVSEWQNSNVGHKTSWF